MAEGDAPPGGPPNGNFNNVNVNTARVGRVTVERLDSRTGGPRDSNNELVDQIKVLGDRLDTSLSAMLEQLRQIKTADNKSNQADDRVTKREEKQDKDDAKTQSRILSAEEKMLSQLEKLVKVMSASEKNAEKRNDDLMDAVQQMTSGVHKDITAGLKQYVSAHRTVIRELMQQMRDGAHVKLGESHTGYGSRRANRNAHYWAKYGYGDAGTMVTRDMAEEMMKLRDKLKRGAGHIGDASMTYVRQKYIEDSHSGAERWSTQLDRGVGNLIGFNNTIDYATKKWKQFTEVASTGVGSFGDVFFSDFTKFAMAGDALGETFDMLRKSAKAGFENNDAQIFIANRTLQQASETIRTLRKGTQAAGFNTDAYMGFRDANEVLGDILTQLKRAGLMQMMNDDQQTRYMAEQLKMAQLVAENTGLTVKEVIKLNNETMKRSAEFVAAGMLGQNQKAAYDETLMRLSANKPVQQMIQQMIAAGGFEQFMAQDKDRARGLIVSGTDNALRQADRLIKSGGDPRMVADMVTESLRQAGIDARDRTQSMGSNVSGAIMRGDMPAFLASLNQIAQYGNKNAPGQGSTVMASVNALEDFLSNKVPWDALKALIGVPALLLTANVLLTTIAVNTGGMSGVGGMIKKTLFRGGAGAAATAAAGAGLGGAGMAAGATAAGGATLASIGAFAKTAGRFALKGLPVVGGLAGGALDRAGGGSLLGAILTGAASGGALGGIGGAVGGLGVGAIPGAILGAIAGGVTGAVGYGITDAAMGGPAPATATPTPPSYSSSSTDSMAILGRGMYARMDTQISKLDELIKVVKEQNISVAMSQTALNQMVPQGNTGASEPGSFLGQITKLWG